MDNFDVSMNSSNAKRLSHWRSLWNTIPQIEDDRVSKEDAVECISQNCGTSLSPGIRRALEHQIDVNQDDMCDYYEFARACEKVIGQWELLDGGQALRSPALSFFDLCNSNIELDLKQQKQE